MKLLSFLLSGFFALSYISLLLIFHVLQWIGLNLFGYKGHKIVVDYMNYALMKLTLILGIYTKFNNKFKLDKDVTYIIVANHQSLFDISPLHWFFRRLHPKFVSKIELAKGIPSVSYNLRNGGSVVIDRSKRGAALKELLLFGKKIDANKWSAVIFPEGTRSKTGKPKSFAASGLKILAKTNPEAYFIPVSINNSWHAFKYGKFPLGLFKTITFEVHKPIKISSLPFDELLVKMESIIVEGVHSIQE